VTGALADTVLQRWLIRWVDVGLAETGMTQRALAQQVGITEQRLSQLLNSRAGGSLHVWDRLLSVAGVLDAAVGEQDRLAGELAAVRALVEHARKVSTSDRMTVLVGDLEWALGLRSERARTKGGVSDPPPDDPDAGRRGD
jgi:transcriptional regulator with XRE-family HTH domain